MKSFQVKYAKEVQEVQANSFQDLKAKITSAFQIDPDKLKIIKPMLKDQASFQACKEKDLAIIGPKKPIEKSQSQTLKQPSKPKYLIAGLDCQELRKENSEWYALFYLLLSIQQLRNWAQNIPLQSNIWAWSFNKTVKQVILPKSLNPVNLFKMICAWAKVRIENDIGCLTRPRPAQIIAELPDILDKKSKAIKNLFLFQAEYKAENITLQLTGKPAQRLIQAKDGIVKHQLGFLPLKAYLNNKIHLNQLMDKDSIELRQGLEFTDTDDFSFDERFFRFTELSTYLFIELNRFQPRKPNQNLDMNHPIERIPQSRQKRTYPIQYPKFIDVYDMCSDQYKVRNKATRTKLDTFIDKHRAGIQNEKKRLKNPYLTEKQIAFSAFDNGLLTQEQLEHLYNSCTDEKNPNCHTGVYRLVGFTTHEGGSEPTERDYGTVFQYSKDVWFHCKGTEVKQLSPEQAFTKYQGFQTAKYLEVETADLLMYRKVFMAEEFDVN